MVSIIPAGGHRRATLLLQSDDDRSSAVLAKFCVHLSAAGRVGMRSGDTERN